MNFGEAIEALKQGKMVRRSVHGRHNFIFRQVPSEIPAHVVPGMTSLPETVKGEFIRRFNDHSVQPYSIRYENQLAFVDGENRITGYAPSIADVMADDWRIVE
jgi:hypothetical protein